MADDRRHAVIFVAQRVAGKSLADLVERDDLKPFGQRYEVEVPGVGAGSGIGAAKIAAVDEHDRLAGPGNMI